MVQNWVKGKAVATLYIEERTVAMNMVNTPQQSGQLLTEL